MSNFEFSSVLYGLFLIITLHVGTLLSISELCSCYIHSQSSPSLSPSFFQSAVHPHEQFNAAEYTHKTIFAAISLDVIPPPNPCEFEEFAYKVRTRMWVSHTHPPDWRIQSLS